MISCLLVLLQYYSVNNIFSERWWYFCDSTIFSYASIICYSTIIFFLKYRQSLLLSQPMVRNYIISSRYSLLLYRHTNDKRNKVAIAGLQPPCSALVAKSWVISCILYLTEPHREYYTSNLHTDNSSCRLTVGPRASNCWRYRMGSLGATAGKRPALLLSFLHCLFSKNIITKNIDTAKS